MDVSRCVQEKVIQTEKERRHGNPVRSRILPRCQNLGDKESYCLSICSAKWKTA